MTLRIKCKQCGFDHISNIYRLEEHNFHRNFSNLESCPSCGYVSKCDASDYKSNPVDKTTLDEDNSNAPFLKT